MIFSIMIRNLWEHQNPFEDLIVLAAGQPQPFSRISFFGGQYSRKRFTNMDYGAASWNRRLEVSRFRERVLFVF